MAKIKLNLQEYGRLSEPQSRIPKVLKGEKGDKGDPGEKGDPGIPGQQGEPGHSPVITASKSGTTTTIYADGVPIAQIEDGEGRMPEITAEKVGTVTTIYVDGEPLYTISDGTDGQDGQDGHSPVITTTRSGKVVTILSDGVSIGTVSDGTDGQDGHSPQVTASKAGKVTTISVDGTPIATVNDGQAGQKGDTGISPSVSVSTITGGHRVSVTDASGTDSFDVMDGADGQDGSDGHSPQVTASKSGKVTTISVDGTPIATVNDGADGQDGSDGQDGKSAYEYAQDGGYTGTEQEFAQKLAEEYVTDVQVNGNSIVTDGVADIIYKDWELIADYTTTEDAAEVEVYTDINGEPFELVKMLTRASLPHTTTGTQDYVKGSTFYKTVGGGSAKTGPLSTVRYTSATAKVYFEYYNEVICGVARIQARAGASENNSQNLQNSSFPDMTTQSNNMIASLWGIALKQYNASSTLIPAGTRIQIYGIRK